MAADAWVIHDKAKQYMGNGAIDIDNDALKVALFLSTSNVATTSVDGFAAATNEHAAANGYPAGGVALANVTWNEASGVVTLDADDPVFSASGGSIVARFAVLYDDTAAGKPIIAHCLMDNTPADITVTDGNTLTLQLPASGFFQVS